MRVSSNRRPRGGRSNTGNGGRSGSSGGRHNSGNNRRSNSGNRSYDSNGPDGKIRGSASQVYDKYSSLARDAQTSSDPVGAENFFQHAEHYFRIMLANNLVKQERPTDASSSEENAAESDGEDVAVAENSETSQSEQSVSEKREVEATVEQESKVDEQKNEPEEPIIINLSDPDPEVEEVVAPETAADEEKPKTKRRVSRTRGLRRRSSRRSEDASETDEPLPSE